MLYSGGSEGEKADFLYKLCESESSRCILNHSQKLQVIVEILATIPSVVVGDMMS
jgi:hypothetical protein